MKKIRPVQLVAVIFFTVSGGPYGLEPLLTYAGQHGAILLLLITPLLWDVPAIYTVLELNSMMPVTGGYYKWVKHALGTRWGFYEGWWTWLYTFVDLAIYPVLFVQYAAFFYPELNLHKTEICLIIIWASAGLNILGIVPVGKVTLFLSAVVLTPFIILFVLAFYHHTGSIALPAPSLKGIGMSSLGMALYTVMWNCLGWDNTTTYAEEVEKPVRSYLVSMMIAFILVITVYVLVIWVAQFSGINATTLMNDGFPALAALVGGHWLGTLIAIGGMASTLGIYASVLLSVSRVPMVMADDKLLPAELKRQHKKFNTPYVSIIVCSVVVSGMIQWGFTDLLIIDVIVYGAGLSLEYISLIKMRIKEPDRHRPFKIPLGIPGLCIGLILPVAIYFTALAGALSSTPGAILAALFAIITLLSAEVLWQVIRWSKRGKV
ncbi:amino acid/polyamine/organocation transporter, APC superfamily [Mucilaginibacter mallensis]|uniref:Amino acid/polyamine/organocation transporter, APC superfamily n=1 Tax=Mucilaginibacter mallensis TaxID=652787 RepID=A0A1H1P2G0_MUCMA|nr:APC family permease [Mucilaginibacter mallensis]SDS05363.1 amino acid/polyamine/organocation transporter, APC superfamily [Mucilaginibacter mallensis]